jgi:hypothetical protein
MAGKKDMRKIKKDTIQTSPIAKVSILTFSPLNPTTGTWPDTSCIRAAALRPPGQTRPEE